MTAKRLRCEVGCESKLGKPTNLDAELQELVTGQAAVDAYRERIEAEDLKACEHVEGFED